MTTPDYSKLPSDFYADDETSMQNATWGLYPGAIRDTSVVSPSFTWSNAWDKTKSFGSWLMGNKDFSPLQTFNALLGTGFDYFQNKDNYKIARDTLNNQMAMARANLGTSIGNALGSRADKAQLMAGWSQKAGSDYVNHSQDIADGLIQLAGNAGVDTSAMKNYKNAIEQYNLLGH